jgi:hypothetical protein
MEDALNQNIQAYVTRYRLQLSEPLGFGMHGNVFAVEYNSKVDRAAIKAHRFDTCYVRERAVYQRLKALGISEILGFHVPQLIRTDDEFFVIEMSVVTRPFLLDFAGAYLDTLPDFSEEVWGEWEAKGLENFGKRWPTVLAVLGQLEEFDIHMLDVSPNNISFID